MSAEKDIVESLEVRADFLDAGGVVNSGVVQLIREAAAEIVRLRGEVDRMSGTYGQAPICYGLRVKGSASVVGVLPMKVMEHPPTSREYMERYEEIPLYAAPVRESIAPAEAKGDSVKNAHTEHCCVVHGCKYGDIACPVVCAEQAQSFPCEDCTPQPAGGEAVAWNVLRIGNYGAAYDSPGTHRAFTYDHQPGNVDAGRLGGARNAAANMSGGDNIDFGLGLLKALQDAGFGVFQIGPEAITPPAAQVQAAHPSASELEVAKKHSAQEDYEHFLAYSGLTHDPLLRYAYFHGADEGIDRPEAAQSGDALAALVAEWRADGDEDERNGSKDTAACVRVCANQLEAALQHRGDSQEVGRG